MSKTELLSQISKVTGVSMASLQKLQASNQRYLEHLDQPPQNVSPDLQVEISDSLRSDSQYFQELLREATASTQSSTK